MKILLGLLLTLSLRAASYTSVQSGNASSQATWGGSGPPGNGDTVTISTGTVVTVDVNMTWGLSGINGTTAVTQSGTGQLVIAAGVTFVIRGNFIGNGNGNLTPLVLLNPGATWEFDSSAAVSPSSTKYEFTTGNLGAWVFLQANGTALNRCSVQSNVGGGSGYFDGSVETVGGGIIATYTDFLRIDHFYPSFSNFGSVVWNVTNSTFNTCGIIFNATAYVYPTNVFIHNNNVHSNTVGSYNMMITFTGGSVGVGGARQIENNVFDAQVGNSSSVAWVPDSVTITGNYFGQCIQGNPNTGVWALFQYNFVLQQAAGCLVISGNMLNNYVVRNLYTATHVHNPDVSVVAPYASVLYNIFDGTYYNLGGITVVDGVVLDENTPGSAITSTIKYNIVLPTGNGVGSQGIIDIEGQNTAALDIEHNTLVCALTACLWMEYLSPTGGVSDRGTLSNNIFYSLPAQANTAGALNANFGGEYPITNLFAPTSIQNNLRYNIKPTGGVSGSTNEGNGYWGAWSVTPGYSDTVANPGFVDPTRNMATFDTAYFNHVASATWASESTSHTFNVGDIISDQNAAYYANALINYRCISSHVKSTANSEPGVGSAFQTYWEFASLYTIRGLIGTPVIQTLLNWVTAGFTPRLAGIGNGATDGTAIGAVKPILIGAWQ